MSSTNVNGGLLFSLYERYVGEPKSKKQVYGYWVFLLGSLIGFAGVALFVANTRPGSTDIEARISYTLAMIGLPVALMGIVLLLPVRDRAIQAAKVGLGITVLGMFGFNYAYPNDWAGYGNDYTTQVVAVFATGLAIIAGVVMLVPILTGKEGMLVEDEVRGLDSHPPVMVGQKDEGTLFSVFRTPGKHWTWRAVQQTALAGSAESSESRTAAKGAVEKVKAKVKEARLMEITTAAFRLYENEDGKWRWVLMRDDGSVVAESDEEYESRNETESSVNFTKDEGKEAPVLEIDGAAFDCYRDGDHWRWRLLDEDRTVLAESPETYNDEPSAQRSVEEMTQWVSDARVLAIDSVGIELFQTDDDQWRWRLLGEDESEIAVSAEPFESRRRAEADADDVLEGLSDATVIESGTPGYEVYEIGGDWEWRLLDRHDEIVARNNPEVTDRTAVRKDAERMADAAEDANVFEIEHADYEVYRDDEGWNWRFVTDDRRIIADHTEGYETPEAAEEVIEAVRGQADEADLLEFENAAFQQYQTDDGDWRWRLIDEGGAVLADSGEAYESKQDAGSAMATLKEKAPDAELLEIETAAFELFTDDDGQWGWRLIDEGGRLIADGAERHSTKQAAREAMDYLVEHSPSAEVRTIEGAGFQLYTDENDEWQWKCVYQDNTVLSVSPDSYGTRDDARAAIGDLKPTAAGANIHVIEGLAFEIDPKKNRKWNIVDQQRNVVANGREEYEDAEAARNAIETLRGTAEDAMIFQIEGAAIRLSEGADGWRWELIDRDRTVYARSAETYDVRARAASVIDEVRSLAPDAGLLEFETAGFEVYEEDGQWHWQLLDSNESVVASSAVGQDDYEAAREAVDDVKSLLADASVLEIDDPTFELHQVEGGWIWRLVDEDGNSLAESVQTYATRADAREEMNTLKEFAPDGSLSVAG